MDATLPTEFNIAGPIKSPAFPAYNQGQVGSCTCNAIASAYRFELKRTGKPDIHPSRMFLYFLARDPIPKTAADHYMQGKLQSTGTSPRETLKLLQKFGVCEEPLTDVNGATWDPSQTPGQWPYDTAGPTPPGTVYTVNQMPGKCPTEECYNQAKQHLTFSYMRPARTIDCWKRCILSEFPITFIFKVFPSFQDPNMALWGDSIDAPRSVAPVPTQKDVDDFIAKFNANPGTPIPRHAVLAVGFHDNIPYKDKNGDQAHGCFIVQNSWGSGWGRLNGFFYMPYAWLNEVYNIAPAGDMLNPVIQVIDEPAAWILLESNDGIKPKP
ncbi:hypothetical protein AA313_de0210354 [Arthrobotrys entomopaga]|nr:hypothetical protein AA313_de0210354 [Arthrobotrys entomopaga]